MPGSLSIPLPHRSSAVLLTMSSMRRTYPLGKKDTAEPMKFPEASGVPANMLPRSDANAFD